MKTKKRRVRSLASRNRKKLLLCLYVSGLGYSHCTVLVGSLFSHYSHEYIRFVLFAIPSNLLPYVLCGTKGLMIVIGVSTAQSIFLPLS
jgi:hypothetical protein